MDTVLVVEDSALLQRALRRLFEAAGLQVRIASDGLTGVETFLECRPTAVVLDLKLPGLPGKELCRRFKEYAPTVPIVIVSADAAVDDKVLLLELGADDYVTKPFSPKELLARVRRAIISSGLKPVGGGVETIQHELLAFDDVQIDFMALEAKRDGKPVTLTAQEFGLLKFFSQSSSRVISREELLNEVWGRDTHAGTRVVDNCILRLRQKLEPNPARPRYLLTIRGAGYRFTASNPSSSWNK